MCVKRKGEMMKQIEERKRNREGGVGGGGAGVVKGKTRRWIGISLTAFHLYSNTT